MKTKIQFEELSVTNGVMLEVKRLALVALQMCWFGLPDELQCTALDKKEASEVLCPLLVT